MPSPRLPTNLMVRSISGALRGRRKALAGFCFDLCLPTLRFLGLPLLAFGRLIIWPLINLQRGFPARHLIQITAGGDLVSSFLCMPSSWPCFQTRPNRPVCPQIGRPHAVQLLQAHLASQIGLEWRILSLRGRKTERSQSHYDAPIVRGLYQDPRLE